MQKLAFSAMVIGALGMLGTLGCGGSKAKADASVYIPVDGSVGNGDAGDGGVTATCDPYKKTGCSANQKCADKVDQLPNDAGSPELDETTCVPDGTVDEGGACMYGSVSGGMGYDNCKAGLACVGGVCQKICDTTVGSSCGANQTCLGFSDLFMGTNYGACQPSCDPVAQDCQSSAVACYELPTTGKGVCGAPEQGAEAQTQDKSCALFMGQIYLNSCAKGYGCLLPMSTSDQNLDTCGFFCNPGSTTDSQGKHIGCDATFPPTDGGLAHANGPGPGYECRYLNSLYQGAQNIPDSVGVCLSTATFGSCTDSGHMMDPGCMPVGSMTADAGTPAARKMPRRLIKQLKAMGYMK